VYAIKVQINDGPATLGGAPDLSVLTAILSAAGRLGPATVLKRDAVTPHFSFRLGGLTSRGEGQRDEHVGWLESNDLNLGDRVSLQIVETENPDPIVGGKEAEQRKSDEREYFEHCKRTYLALREKYEDVA